MAAAQAIPAAATTEAEVDDRELVRAAADENCRREEATTRRLAARTAEEVNIIFFLVNRNGRRVRSTMKSEMSYSMCVCCSIDGGGASG